MRGGEALNTSIARYVSKVCCPGNIFEENKKNCRGPQGRKEAVFISTRGLAIAVTRGFRRGAARASSRKRAKKPA
jgi:hypothetical protein